VRLEGLGKLKTNNSTHRSRTRELPVSSIMHQPLCYRVSTSVEVGFLNMLNVTVICKFVTVKFK
jgi:hypothetical protein